MLKLLYVTDLHGWQGGYRHVEQVAAREGVAAVVNGGDMLPKHHGHLLQAQREFLEQFMPSHLEAVSAAGARFLGMFGNDDAQANFYLWRKALAGCEAARELTDGWAELGEGVIVRGVSHVPDHPFGLKDWSVLDYPGFVRPAQLGKPVISAADGFHEIHSMEAFLRERPTLQAMLETMAAEADSLEHAVAVVHCPPADTYLGCAGPDGRDVGSMALLRWINQHQPLLTLHGHIHESPDVTGRHTARLGRSVCHQPGQRGEHQGLLVYSMVTIENGRHIRIERRMDRVG